MMMEDIAMTNKLKLKRRDFCLTAAAALSTPAILTSTLITPARAALNADGLHTQPWFLESFMDLKEDHAELAKKKKKFVIFFEQEGCPYCAAMHEKNLSKPKISKFIQDHFGVLQINLFGAKEVTDFDGKAMEERKIGARWGIQFTPTIIFIRPSLEGLSGLNGKQLTVGKIPGYFRPFHFITYFEYMAGEYYNDVDFQRFLGAKVARLKKQGKKVDLWAE